VSCLNCGSRVVEEWASLIIVVAGGSGGVSGGIESGLSNNAGWCGIPRCVLGDAQLYSKWSLALSLRLLERTMEGANTLVVDELGDFLDVTAEKVPSLLIRRCRTSTTPHTVSEKVSNSLFAAIE
jgi:hypothetical protein